MKHNDPLDVCEDPLERSAALRLADRSGRPFANITEALAWGLEAIAAILIASFLVSSINR